MQLCEDILANRTKIDLLPYPNVISNLNHYVAVPIAIYHHLQLQTEKQGQNS